MLYPFNKVNKIITQRRLWDTQKNIEAVEKWALKKEEQEKKIKKNKFTQWIKSQKLNPLVYGYLLFRL